MAYFYYGIFDWDDNVLHMPTMIKAYDNLKKRFVWLTTERYAEIRSESHNYSFDEDSFDLFYDYIPNNFVMDIQRALMLKTFGPSYEMFLQMVKDGDIIAIVTARGHTSETLKEGCKYLIDYVFTLQDRKIWHDNLRKLRKYRTGDESVIFDYELEAEYWDMCFFTGLGAKKGEIGKLIRKVEDEKQKSITTFVKRVHDDIEKFVKLYDKNSKASIGFSDDDRANLGKIHDLFVELNNIYTVTKFRVYDTSDRGLKKIVI